MRVQEDGGGKDASTGAAHVPSPLMLAETESKTLPPPAKGETHWNTHNLGLRVGADAASAAAAGILVAPIVCTIDRSIIEKAATGSSFKSCFFRALRLPLTRPHAFLVSRPFLLIFTLYYSTYFAANSIDTITSTVKSQPASKVKASTAKFVTTSAVNMSICVYKDSQFVKLFGGAASKSPAATIPLLSYALFATRDSMTIFASFNLPPVIAPKLLNLPPPLKQHLSRLLSTESRRNNTAQFFAPAAMQIISTPIHLLGLDVYNRQGRLGFAERFSRVTRDWAVGALARMGRIIPAYGVGGVVNTSLRKRLMTQLE